MRITTHLWAAALLVGGIASVTSASFDAAQDGPGGSRGPQQRPGGAVSSFYDLQTRTLNGEPGNLAQYRGKVSLVVNVASFCGYTPQYAGLEKLHRDLGPKGVVVLGFPSNDFGEQEPGSAEQIAEFCRLTYDVTFPMFEKVVTRRSSNAQSPIYAYLSQSGYLPQWNFAKYVVDKQGQVVAFFPSDVTPEDPRLRAAIDRALAAN